MNRDNAPLFQYAQELRRQIEDEKKANTLAIWLYVAMFAVIGAVVYFF